MKYSESSIQQACVSAFRAKYPWAAKLLIHVKNEESGGRAAGAIHKAEGVVAGAPDLLLLIPTNVNPYLGIEMKSEHGRLRDSQVLYSTYVNTVGARYEVCRSVDQFLQIVSEYMLSVDPVTINALQLTYRAEDADRLNRARQELRNRVAGITKPRRKKAVTEARNELQRILA